MADEEVDHTYARRVGERLRNVRRQQRFSLQGVEAASAEEFKASVLGAYERGERAISVPRLQRLAKFYNVPVDQLIPRDAGAEPTWDRGESEDGPGVRLTLDLQALDSVDAPEKEMIQRYAVALQRQRQDYNGRVLTVRDDDIRVLAVMLGYTPAKLRVRLGELGLEI